ncbi:S-layer homology domain-containing protein [Ureibacillus suwonensis]|uniref:S-layer homology domain-containing protein n=1 Tax=Ureibacillus suwonensis TaxID=313007 RepID=A0ABW0RCE2_9BACL
MKDPGFMDMKPGTYGYEMVAKAVELGIIQGKTNAQGQKFFDPYGKLTRAQMSSILVNAYNLQGTSNITYSDVPKSHWAYNAIQTLTQNKITIGYGDGTFGPNNPITRTQFALMMARLLDESFAPTTPPSNSNQNTPGKTYPDGWTAPTLKSKWSPNTLENFKILQNELGFSDDGRSYDIQGRPGAIQVFGASPSSQYEVYINFYMWDGDAGGLIPQAYRIPIVAKELFKLYFEEDYMTVWNYFDKNDIPENFSAGGRKVHALYDEKNGCLGLQVGRK